jgi:hypothetical protein
MDQRSKRPAAQHSGRPPAFQPVLVPGGGVVAVELPSGVRLELPAQQLQLVRAVLAELLEAEAGCLRGDL